MTSSAQVPEPGRPVVFRGGTVLTVDSASTSTPHTVRRPGCAAQPEKSVPS